MSALIKTLKFCNGVECPVLGLGTYRAKGNEAYEAVKHAIKFGYRHIDTAFAYNNEVDVGRAVNDSIREFNLAREDLFIVTKLTGTCLRPSLVVPGLKQSLRNLNLDYVDLFLIHSPMARAPQAGDVISVDGMNDENGDPVFEDIEPTDTWKSMEECVDLGLTRSIGVSNFNSQQVQAVVDSCRIKPVTNQVECHPYLPQTKLRKFCEERGVLLTTFRALGGQVLKPNHPGLLDNEVVKRIAAKHSRTPSQILLRWQIQQDLIVLAKSSKVDHIESNTEVFEFSLSEEDMEELGKLENGHRYCPFLDTVSSKQYPFHIEF